MNKLIFCVLAAGAVVMSSCREDSAVEPGDTQLGWAFRSGDYNHVYVLNEGMWGQNNARIDTLGFESGTYADDVYTGSNPNQVLGLGDVGNDMRMHGGRLYAVINGSHKVEVMNASDLKRIGQFDINSPRNIAFAGELAFVTSWVGGSNGSGSVAVVNLTTLQPVATLTVGYEPEGIAVANGNLYVACSGGMHGDYMTGQGYEETVWVFDVNTRQLKQKIAVAPNLHRMAADKNGNVWVSARGNYNDKGSGLYRITPEMKVDTVGIACSGFAVGKDKIYYYASDWSNETASYANAFGTVDMTTLAKGGSFIADGADIAIESPYGIAVDGSTGRVFLSDAKNYASSGALCIFDKDGNFEQQYTTGVCPSTILPVATVE